MQQPILVFDIETIVDVKLGRQLYDLELNDDETEHALAKLRRQETGQEFQRLPLHEIVCISGVWIRDGQFKLFSWTQEKFTEDELIRKFFAIFEKYQPILVSWNGSQFDLPLLMVRAMMHGLSAPYLWDQGELYPTKRYNNYVNRYHHYHVDLMDCLAMYHQKHFQKMDDIARAFGLAGKGGKTGSSIADDVKAQDWLAVSQYAESDVLNTWLIYLRWLLLKGQMSVELHHAWVYRTLEEVQRQPYLHDFLQRWQKNAQVSAFSQQFFEKLSS